VAVCDIEGNLTVGRRGGCRGHQAILLNACDCTRASSIARQPPGSSGNDKEVRGVYESRFQPLIPRRAFLRRLGLHGLVALGITVASLGIGMLGYVALGGLSPIDAFLNAAMILGGMGPVDVLQSDAAKLFAGLYALFAGFILLGVAGVILAPIFHRLLHRFHLDSDVPNASEGGAGS
jgi:hypothetical protein